MMRTAANQGARLRATGMATLRQTIPALPVRNAAAAVDFYRDRLGFGVLHHDGGFAATMPFSTSGKRVMRLGASGSRSSSPCAPERSRSSRGRRVAGFWLRAWISCTRKCARATSSILSPRTRSRTPTLARGSSPRSTSTATSSRSSSGQNRERHDHRGIRALPACEPPSWPCPDDHRTRRRRFRRSVNILRGRYPKASSVRRRQGPAHSSLSRIAATRRLTLRKG
jgi:hypothetical protein